MHFVDLEETQLVGLKTGFLKSFKEGLTLEVSMPRTPIPSLFFLKPAFAHAVLIHG